MFSWQKHSSPLDHTEINKLNKIHKNRNSTKWPNLKFIFFIYPLCSFIRCWQMAVGATILPLQLAWFYLVLSVYLVNAGWLFSIELLIFNVFFSLSRFCSKFCKAINSEGLTGKWFKPNQTKKNNCDFIQARLIIFNYVLCVIIIRTTLHVCRYSSLKERVKNDIQVVTTENF